MKEIILGMIMMSVNIIMIISGLDIMKEDKEGKKIVIMSGIIYTLFIILIVKVLQL